MLSTSFTTNTLSPHPLLASPPPFLSKNSNIKMQSKINNSFGSSTSEA